MSRKTASTADLRNVSILVTEAGGLPVSRYYVKRPGFDCLKKQRERGRGRKD